MKYLILILLLLVGFRVGFSYQWAKGGSPEYLIKLNNLRESVTWAGLGAMSTYLFKYCVDKYCSLILYLFILFSFSFVFISLREFMPYSLCNFIIAVRPAFWDTWSIIFICTLVYYGITFRLKSA